jgi:uncharacterized membrane protein
MLRKFSLSLLVIVVFLVHQDFWNWKNAEPFVFGFLPVGLAYHAGYAVLAAIMMALLVKFAWPNDLDRIESKLDDENKTRKP